MNLKRLGFKLIFKFGFIVFILFESFNIDAQSKNDSIQMGAELCRHSETGDLDSVIYYIKKGANLDFKTYYGITPLLYAVETNQLDVVKVLLYNGADPNVKPYNGFTALMNASYNGYFDIAHELVKYNAKLEYKDNLGATALHYASLKGRYFIADMLLHYGADPNSKTNHENTPLMLAAYNNDTIMMNILFKNNVIIDIKNEAHLTALDIAVMYNSEVAASLLLDSGAVINVSADGYSTTSYATINSSDSLFSELLKIDSNQYNKNNFKIPINTAYLLNSKSKINILKQNSYKAKFGFLVDEYSFGNDFTFNGDDFFNKSYFGIHDARLNANFGFGMTYRFGRKKVLHNLFDNNLYLLHERRFFFDVFVSKDFEIINYYQNIFGLFAGLELQYGLGNFKGVDKKAERRFYLNPFGGLYYKKNRLKVKTYYYYTNYNYLKIPNYKIALGFAFLINNTKTPEIYKLPLSEY